jgi:hypothetical protein
MLDSGLVSDLDSPIGKRLARAREEARRLGVDDLATVDLIQAYARGVSRMVSAEMHAAARVVDPEPSHSYDDRLRSFTSMAAELAADVFESLRMEQVANTLERDPGQMLEEDEQTVTFVDLCDSTRFMLQCSAHDLRALVDELFFVAQAVADTNAVSVVKYLGDGVVMLAAEPAAAIDSAQQLVMELRSRTALPAAAGVAHGRVLAHAGDVLGPAVNLASRLAELAAPDEVLVDAEGWPAPLSVGSPREVSPRGLGNGWRVHAIDLAQTGEVRHPALSRPRTPEAGGTALPGLSQTERLLRTSEST